MPRTLVGFGGFTHEGITAAAQAIGYQFLSLDLDRRTPNTWVKRAQKLQLLADNGELAGTVLYLHTTLLLKASEAEFRRAFDEILLQARRSKVIAFVFRDNLDGIFAPRHATTREPMTLTQLQAELREAQENYSDWTVTRMDGAIRRLKDYQIRKAEVDALINSLYAAEIQVAPFFMRSDTTIRLQEFFQDIEQGVFLRLFVPNDRLQSDQMRSLLEVLERYLQQVEGKDFSIDSSKSERGIIYVFRSAEASESLQTLNEAFARFDAFMKLCGDRPEKGAELLRTRGVPDNESAFIVEKYARDYRRLLLDTRHEFERKSLILKQRLESELTDGSHAVTLTWPTEGVSSLVGTLAAAGNISINVGSLSVVNAQAVSAVIDSVVNGSITYNDNDRQLLALFERYATGLEALQCRSDLDQLKDESVSEPNRQNASQRLVGFLRKAAVKAGEVAEKVAVTTLTKYLETLLKGG
jgi:hypothetical protein